MMKQIAQGPALSRDAAQALSIEGQERQALFQSACYVRALLLILLGIYIQSSASALTLFPVLKDGAGYTANLLFWALAGLVLGAFLLNRLRPIGGRELFIFSGIEVVLLFFIIGFGDQVGQGRLDYVSQTILGGKMLVMALPLMLAVMTLSLVNVMAVTLFIFASPFLYVAFILSGDERLMLRGMLEGRFPEGALWRPILLLGVAATAVVLVHRLRRLIASLRATADHAAALDGQFRRFMDATTDQVVVFDRMGHVAIANRAAHERRSGDDADRRLTSYFGRTAAQALTHAASEVAAGPMGASLQVELSMATTGVARAGYATVTRAGEKRESLFVAIVKDIDDLMRVQAELAVARENALAASLAKTAFLGRMSHELRTPLNAVIGFSSLARAEAQMLDPAKGARIDDYLERVETQGGHLTSLIDGVLSYARVEVSGLKIELETEETAETLLNRAIDRRREQADSAAVTLALEDGAGMATALRGDADLLTDALAHLLDNAIRHSAAGQTVRCGLRDGCALTVEDDGPGLAAEKVALALAPLSQVGEYTRADDVGMGLGLAMVRAIAAAHDGALEIDTAPGEGLRAKILLPRARVGGDAQALFRPASSRDGVDEAAA